MFQLSPAQQRAAEGLLRAIPSGSALALSADQGMGNTAVLRHVHSIAGGMFLGLRQFLRELMDRSPLALEEALLELLDQAMRDHELVIVDDLYLIQRVTESCDYTRKSLIDAVLTAVLDDIGCRGRKILFGLRQGDVLESIAQRACVVEMKAFTALDYACILREHLGQELAGRLDCEQIHRFAPLLTTWQLRNACASLALDGDLNSNRFIEYLSEHNIVSNVEVEEVQAVDWKDLKGMDDVVAALEAKIARPFENNELARELRLKPRRGVLLAGPPGTGKTTIGRALARRLKGKFFLIDGTVVARTDEFYRRVRSIFAAAARNAPSVIFIDDTDLIFEGSGEGSGDSGFYRYLATMLDGLESASAERVCVMMTAMDAGSLPPALLRSGRVELWLETRLPDEEARAAIVQERLADLPAPIGTADVALLAGASHGLSGADLKAIIEDGKLSFAHDIATGQAPQSGDHYFLQAIEAVRTNRRNYHKRKPAIFSQPPKIGFTA